MVTCLLVAVALAQKLDTSHVELTERRGLVSQDVRDSRYLDRIDHTSLSRAETADLARITQRFIARAKRHGLSVQDPSEQLSLIVPQADGGVWFDPKLFGVDRPGLPLPSSRQNPPPRPSAVIAVVRKRTTNATTWVLTANQLDGHNVGTDCCAPCPCDANGCVELTRF